jgi:hypothetical protein
MPQIRSGIQKILVVHRVACGLESIPLHILISWEHQVLFGVLFYLLFILLVSSRYYLDVVNFRNLQDLKEQDFVRLQEGEPDKCSLTMLILYAFSL